MNFLIIAAISIFATSAFSQTPARFACFKDWHQQELRVAAMSLSSAYPNLRGVGFGKCLDLPHSSVLAIGLGRAQNLPQDCMGLTFGGADDKELVTIAKWTLKFHNSLIDGENGAAIVEINGLRVEVPICMQSWQNTAHQ